MSNTILFPPIVDTYQKAFIVNEAGNGFLYIKATFPALQENREQISFDVAIQNQNNNISALTNFEDYISFEGAPNIEIEEDSIKLSVPLERVRQSLNSWYRIQIRSFLIENDLKQVSEWSTVTLVKGISEPSFKMDITSKLKENEKVELDSQFLEIGGRVEFSDNQDQEGISSFLIEIFNQFGTLIERSQTIYPSSFDSKRLEPYKCKTIFKNLNSESYTLKISYITRSFYYKEHIFKFEYQPSDSKNLYGDFYVSELNEKGYVEIQLGLNKEDIKNNKHYQILRSSSKDGYSTKEILFNIDLNEYEEYPRIKMVYPLNREKYIQEKEFSQIFSDVTAEPGIIYRYYLTDSKGSEYNVGPEKEIIVNQDIKTIENEGVYEKHIQLYPNTFYLLNNYIHDLSLSESFDLNISFKDEKGKSLFYDFNKEKFILSENDSYYLPIFEKGELLINFPFTIKTSYYKIDMTIFSNEEESLNSMALELNVLESGSNHQTFCEVLLDTEHIFLIDKNAIFKINLNPVVSGYKYITQESITNTLGGVYPFVRRNGQTKYRQFNLTGTISAYGDMEGLFLNSKDVHSLITAPFYKKYKKEHKIFEWNDYLYEKIYREKAISFLMDGKPKVFSSLTEGNIIVSLSAVSFTPNTQLSRNIYDFSATVTEICDTSIENYYNYDIYEKEASKLYSPAEYYLIADEIVFRDNNFVAYSTKENFQPFSDEGYLCLTEVTNMLQASVTPGITQILQKDSLIREGE